jgi:hypothetical protein
LCYILTFFHLSKFLQVFDVGASNRNRTHILCRYMKCLADVFQLKFREGKTKRKKPPHF